MAKAKTRKKPGKTSSRRKQKMTRPRSKLFVGVDFGTYRTTVSTEGSKTEVLSVVGRPRDMVASRFLEKEVLYGEEALKHRVALDLFRPIKDGVLKNKREDIEAAKGLLEHALDTAGVLRARREKFGVIGVPSKASVFSQKLLANLAGDFFDGVMVVSEPFNVAYGMGKLEHTLVVDIGAGTTDLCRVHGTLPTSEDQVSSPKGGDFIDTTLRDLIVGDYTNARVTLEMTRKWKERFAFLGEPPKPIKVTIPVEASMMELDITEEMKEACEAIVPDIMEGISVLISTYDPDFQEALRNDIVLAGGGSQIRGIKKRIADELGLVGGGRVSVVDDPVFAGSDGALRLAKDIPEDYWKQMK
jgi:rod shape-determining protein MreB